MVAVPSAKSRVAVCTDMEPMELVWTSRLPQVVGCLLPPRHYVTSRPDDKTTRLRVSGKRPTQDSAKGRIYVVVALLELPPEGFGVAWLFRSLI